MAPVAQVAMAASGEEMAAGRGSAAVVAAPEAAVREVACLEAAAQAADQTAVVQEEAWQGHQRNAMG